MGYSDSRISELSNIKIKEIKNYKKNNNIKPVFKRVDTCAGEFKSFTPYLYSTYNLDKNYLTECESNHQIKIK